MYSTKFMRSFAKLDKIRFWMSCKLYRNPIFLPTAFLILGGFIGVVSSNSTLLKTKDNQLAANSLASTTNNPQIEQAKLLRTMSVRLSRLQARADRLDSLRQQWRPIMYWQHNGTPLLDLYEELYPLDVSPED